jgi:hypothetical protein
MIEKFKHLGRQTLDIAWVAVILFLPITSLPLLSRLAGNTMVAPASFVPLLWLVFFWFIYYLANKGTIPRESIPFFCFISIAVVVSAYAFFLDTPPFKDGNILGQEISAILTLLIGAAFYLVTSSWLAQSQSRLISTLKWINISGMVMLLWATIQAVYIFLFHGKFPTFLLDFQRLISTRDLFATRITAFAFEPSWLAQQLNLVYLPFWLAATINGWSTFRFRLWKFSLENILLGIGVVVLFVSSRVGTLSLLLIIAFLCIYLNIILARRLQLWSLARFVRFPAIFQKVVRGLLPALILFAFLGIYILGALVLVYGLSHVDWRLARFFQIKSLDQLKALTGNIYLLFNYLAFAERYVYWVAGWNIFNIHSILGVGLGNAGFYFQHALPAYSWSLPEVMQVYFRDAGLPNIKSIWVRLLAETGIVGFSSFIAWCYVMVRSAWSMRLNSRIPFKVIGWSGLFVLIAFFSEGFSTDTFALPYLWISLGIVSAAGALLRNPRDGG